MANCYHSVYSAEFPLRFSAHSISLILKQVPTMQAGIRDIFVMLSSRGATIVIALAFQSALAWLLGPDGRGQYAVCMTFQLMLSYFFIFGLDWSAKYYVASNKLSLSEAVSLFWTHLVFLILIGCPLGLCLCKLPISFFAKAPSEAFLLSTFWMVSSSAFIIATAHLQALKAFPLLAACSILYGLLSLAIAIFCIFFLNMGLLGAIAADMISSTLIVIFIQFRLFARYRFSWQFPAASKIKVFFFYGWRTFIGTMAMQLNLRISTILLAFFSTEAQIGFFCCCTRLSLSNNRNSSNGRGHYSATDRGKQRWEAGVDSVLCPQSVFIHFRHRLCFSIAKKSHYTGPFPPGFFGNYPAALDTHSDNTDPNSFKRFVPVFQWYQFSGNRFSNNRYRFCGKLFFPSSTASRLWSDRGGMVCFIERSLRNDLCP